MPFCPGLGIAGVVSESRGSQVAGVVGQSTVQSVASLVVLVPLPCSESNKTAVAKAILFQAELVGVQSAYSRLRNHVESAIPTRTRSTSIVVAVAGKFRNNQCRPRPGLSPRAPFDPRSAISSLEHRHCIWSDEISSLTGPCIAKVA